MTLDKTHLIVFCVGIFLGLCTGFFTGKALYDKPIEVGIKRDTVTLHDTVSQYLPTPKDSIRTKWITRWLPSSPDTIDHFVEVSKLVHDSVAVAVPITSKHYGGKNYDAYVSGFEVKMDSIFVYNETQVITETITKIKPPNKFELDIVGGIDYNTSSQRYVPYAGGEFLYKPNRLHVGVRAGVSKTEKAEPYVGGVVKIRIL